MSNTLNDCCFKGFRHDGDTKGKIVDFHGVKAYVSGDESIAKDKIIVIVTDIFGHVFKNNQLIADQFGEAGYYVIVPDLFEGDSVVFGQIPADLKTVWFSKHSFEIVWPILEKVFDNIKADYDPRYLAATGYCYGAKLVVDLQKEGRVSAGAIHHPTAITEENLKAIKSPLLISAAEIDGSYNKEIRHKSEDALTEAGVIYQINLFSGVEHGFAVRGDISKPLVKYAKEKVFSDTVGWFNFTSGL